MPQLLFSYTRLVLFSAVWWFFWILVQSKVLHAYGWPYGISFTDAILSNTILALLSAAITNLHRFYQPARNKLLFHAGICLFLSPVHLYSAQAMLKWLFSDNETYVDFLEQSIHARFMFSLLMMVSMTLLSWMWFYMKELQENKNRKSEAEKLLREAELAGLRQQLQPHFLFNSLNSISALVGFKPDEARKMIQNLSDFLRGTLKKDDQQLVPLRDELQHLQLYLDIEKVRFGHRLNTAIDYTEAALDMKLPSLLLQPVVENAIKFGLYDTTENITINISAAVASRQLLLKVENPFDTETASGRKGSGFGLSSVKRRLYLLYARKDLLQTEQDGSQFITSIKIPQHD